MESLQARQEAFQEPIPAAAGEHLDFGVDLFGSSAARKVTVNSFAPFSGFTTMTSGEKRQRVISLPDYPGETPYEQALNIELPSTAITASTDKQLHVVLTVAPATLSLSGTDLLCFLTDPQAVHAVESDWLAELYAELDRLGHLREAWDTYDSPIPTAIAIRNAREVLKASVGAKVKPSAVLPSSEGGVFISFDRSGRHANIECLNDGETYAAIRDPLDVWPVATNDLASTFQKIAEYLERR